MERTKLAAMPRCCLPSEVCEQPGFFQNRRYVAQRQNDVVQRPLKTPSCRRREFINTGIAPEAKFQFFADLVGRKDAGDHVCVFQGSPVLVPNGLNQARRKSPLLHQHGADDRMVNADDFLLSQMQGDFVPLAVLQGCPKFRRNEMRRHHFGKVVQQAGNKTVGGFKCESS